MPKVSSKRQITLPIELCEMANIKPGDEIEAFIYQGQITIVKKTKGAAKGLLSHIKADKRLSDEDSLQNTLNVRHKGAA
ncbi:MAG: AbrB/MazE/SpoVT family DNA-binding domain-containing protein [Gammaproteobacteria bacterium]|nr:AbrB/MazE/SpoVT family DNA-binding domain-containing protein [Gammaproteobacteria bacterium]